MSWIKLNAEWEDHDAGDEIKVKKSQATDLIAKGIAIESQAPERQLIDGAVKALQGSVGKDVAESVDKALKNIMEATKTAKERYAPHFLTEGIAGATHGQTGRLVDGQNGMLSLQTYFPQAPDRDGKCFGDWLVHVREAGNGSVASQKRLFDTYGSKMVLENGDMIQKTTLTEQSGVVGGYTVPVEFMMQLQALAVQEEVVYPRARKIPMSARTIMIPALDHTTLQSAGNTAFLGGMVMSWVEEATNRPETNPQFKQIELTAHELGGYVPVSNTLLADNAVALDALLTPLMAKGVGWHRDYAFLRGDGVGKPLGVLNAPASISVSRNAATSFKLVDAASMLSRLLISSMSNACWVMSQTVIPQLVQMTDAGNRVVWIPLSGGATQAIPTTLFGLPIIYTEKLPALGTAGDAMLLDLSAYLIGDRMQVEIMSSIHALFRQNQTAWRCTGRFDGQPWLDSTIRLADGVTTVSPFIYLT